MVWKLNKKGTVANENTKELCLKKNIYFLRHLDFNPKYHLNGSKLHPNKKGKTAMYLMILLLML